MGTAARAGHPRVGLGVGTRLCAGSIVLLPFVGLLGARRARVWGQPCPGTALSGDGPVRGRCDTEQRPTGAPCAHGGALSELPR